MNWTPGVSWQGTVNAKTPTHCARGPVTGAEGG